jgi:hypothetical protein
MIVFVGYTAALIATLIFQQRHLFRARVVQSFQLFVSGILLASPYYVIHGEQVFEYTYNAVVRDKAIWAGMGGGDIPGWWKQLTFYLTGVGGRMMLGKYFLLGLVNIIAAVFIIRRQGGVPLARFLVLLCVIVLAWLVPTLSIVKTQFLGATFYYLFIGLSFIAIQAIYTRLFRYKAAYAASYLAALVLLALFSFKLPPSWGKHDSDPVISRVTLFNEIISDLERGCNEMADTNCKVGVLFTGYINKYNIKYALLKRGMRNIDVVDHFLRPDEDVEEKLGKLIETSRFVLIAEPGTGIVNENLPIGKVLDRSLALIVRYPSYQRIETYTTDTHSHIYLYRQETHVQ